MLFIDYKISAQRYTELLKKELHFRLIIAKSSETNNCTKRFAYNIWSS